MRYYFETPPLDIFCDATIQMFVIPYNGEWLNNPGWKRMRYILTDPRILHMEHIAV